MQYSQKNIKGWIDQIGADLTAAAAAGPSCGVGQQLQAISRGLGYLILAVVVRRQGIQQSSIRTLIALIEERLRSVDVIDREDKREKRLLEGSIWS